MSGEISIRPWTPQWNAWLNFYRGTKNVDLMFKCIADAAIDRALWLRDRLAVVLASDVAAQDVLIRDCEDARTTIVVRGVMQFEATFAAAWSAPAEWPPQASVGGVTARTEVAAPAANTERRSLGDGELDQIADRLEKRADRNEIEQETKKQRKRDTRRADEALSAAQKITLAGHAPYINGNDALGTLVVNDPHDGKPRTKITSLRDDPVGQMHKRGQLGAGSLGDARLKAARRWQTLYEQAEIGGARGIDYKEHVDGGRFETPDTDSRLRAQDEMNHLRRVMGANGDRLVTWVLGHKLSVAKVAEMLGRRRPIDRAILGHRFSECLDTLVEELGIALGSAGARGPKRKSDQHDRDARYADNPPLHRAVRQARA